MKNVVAGNWKMNLNHKEALQLFDHLLNASANLANVEMIIAPPSIYMAEFSSRLTADSKLKLAAQNVHYMPAGAFTGEISAGMLLSLEVEYCIVGHSERRMFFNETDETVGKKTKALIDSGIKPIICVGELLDERYANRHFDVVENQVKLALAELTTDEVAQVLIAYEPVWAIGTGQTATTDQAQEMHNFIRKQLLQATNEEIANNVSILYGGSCNAQNAKELFSQVDVNGGLVGGASLNASDFMQIAKSFN